MDLRPSAEHAAFGARLAAFLAAHAGEAPAAGLEGDRAPIVAWQRRLIAEGFAARTVPEAYGGRGEAPDPVKARLVRQAFAAAGVPGPLAGQGVSMLVPTLLEFGTEAQKRAYVPPTLTGETIWCQGYSEPGAGSDLASLSTRADLDGDDFVVNGQKIWTSTAQHADMMFLLCRTDPDAPRHAGMSYLLLSMRTPGIEVRPLRTMTGGAEFNEVFFTDVRVPRHQIVGAPGQGWAVANATLRHERGMLGDPDEAEARLAAVLELLRAERLEGRPLIEDPLLRDRFLRLQGRALALRCNALRALSADLDGRPAGLAGLIVKLTGCELNHQIAAFAIDALGELGTLYPTGARVRADGRWPWRMMFDLGLIIGGGTAQIQKSIIAERGLGLPREPRPPRAAPRGEGAHAL